MKHRLPSNTIIRTPHLLPASGTGYRLPTLAFLLLLGTCARAQSMFTNASTLLEDQTITSGVAVGVVDVDRDGLDDIVRFQDGRQLRVELQRADGTFRALVYPTPLETSTWSVAVADADGDGLRDFGVGGFSGTTGVLLNRGGEAPGYTNVPFGTEITLLQGANFVDIDNDGYLDYFACDDNRLSVPYRGYGNGAFTADPTLIHPETPFPSDNSGNYASLWTDYDNDGDLDLYLSRCRLGVSDPFDGRRVNSLYRNDGNGAWTEVGLAANLRPYAQTWAADFADIDNDGDLDAFLVLHDVPSRLYRNEGNNQYVDVTATYLDANSLAVGATGIQCNFDDYDNDGYVDLLVTHTDGIPLALHRNRGGNGFDWLPLGTVLPSTEFPGVQSAATGDLNDDGYLDLYAAYADGYNNPTLRPDGLFLNTGGNNHYLKFDLTGTMSNADAIGARITLLDADWGTQLREVRSGEGYGIMNSLTKHFGLAQTTSVDSVVIRWPSGLADTLTDVAANQTLRLTEGAEAGPTVDVTDFAAAVVGNQQVAVSWTAVTAPTTADYVVQRRSTDADWTDVITRPIVAYPGRHAYRFLDPFAPHGTVNYRLRRRLTDGRHADSAPRSVNIDRESVVLFPNPSPGHLVLRSRTDKSQPVRVRTVAGAQVRATELRPGTDLRIAGLVPGVYLIYVGTEVRRVVVRR